MLEINKKESILNKIISWLCDPVLIYTVLIMMSIMYHYRSSLTFVYGAASLIIGALVFKVFDFISMHKILGAAAYLSLGSAFLLAIKTCIEIGEQEYPLKFFIWFMTPQDVLDYSKWYTIAIYLLFMFFMASVIYYFTKVRYRIFMNFLIFIIPFAIYGKEYEKMPIVFIILLAIGYIVIMISCRQLKTDSEAVIINKKQIWSSMGAYIIAFASIASIIPKPQVKEDRSYIEEMISADAFTDKLNEMLNVFRDTSTGDNFRAINDENIVYFASSDEDLRLKTQTFSTYDFKKDSWSVSRNDTHFDYTTAEKPIEAAPTGELLQLIAAAAENDKAFAKKYGLTGFSTEKIRIPEIKKLTLYTAGSSAQYAPVPTLFAGISETTCKKEIALLISGVVYCADRFFSANESFTFEYCEDSFFDDAENKRLADMMCRDDYYDMLYDCAVSLADEDYKKARQLSSHYWQSEDFDKYLDYGDNSEIEALAQQITEGITSDYDRAKAIERYFAQNDYVYDLSYKKEKGENAVDFLFESKRGVCYEFATSMVLLSRAAGIPARYTEGYNMFEKYKNEKLSTNYVIKSKAAHGFPELYIRGVGWMSFEPTVSSNGPDAAADKTVSANLSMAGIFLLIAGIMFIICMKLYPKVSHRVFLIKINKAADNTAVILIMQRICRLLKIDSSMTSHEAAEKVYKLTGVQLTDSADIFDKAAYSSDSVSRQDFEETRNGYLLVYEAIKNRKKHSGKQRM